MRKLGKLMMLGLMLAVIAVPAMTLVGCGGNGGDVEAGPTFTNIMFREQRAPSRGFYRVGYIETFADHDENTRGHFGVQATGAIRYSNNTMEVNTSAHATQIAVDVRNMFADFNKLTELGIRVHVPGQADTVGWVNLRSTENDTTTDGEHFHVYTTVDAGWVAGHVPAYFVVNVLETARTIEVAGKHNNKDFNFFITITRAA